jgi:hypothetical protein
MVPFSRLLDPKSHFLQDGHRLVVLCEALVVGEEGPPSAAVNNGDGGGGAVAVGDLG